MSEETMRLVEYSIGDGQLRRSQPEPPVVFRNSKGEIVPNEKTLRDEFAIAALANSQEIFNSPDEAAGYAYAMADAMMKERLKSTA